MSLLKKFASAAVTMLAICLPAQAFADTWVRAESAHFIVYSNLGAPRASSYAKRLEQYRHVLGKFYSDQVEDGAAESKLTLHLLGSRSEFKQVWPTVSEDVAGFVRICAEGTAGYSEYDTTLRAKAQTKPGKLELGAENYSEAVIFHEYAHMFMFQHSQVVYPRWFVEGFAEYFSTIKLVDDQAAVGMAWSYRYRELSAAGDAIKYEDILRDSPDIKQDQRTQSAFYAQSWLLTHYILSDPGRSRAFDVYLEARNRGDDPIAAFESAFGIQVRDLGQILHRYLEKEAPVTTYTLKTIADSQVTTSGLPASADKLLLWNSASTTCITRDYIVPLLQKIRTEAARYPGDDYAQGVLMRAEISLGEEKDALAYFQGYTATHPQDGEGYFRLGQVWYLMAFHDKIAPGETRDSQIKKARAAFIKGYQYDPVNAVNLYYLSLTAPAAPAVPDDTSVNAARQAYVLAPAVGEYALNVALLLVRQGNLEEARYAIMPLANNPHGGDFSKEMTAIIAAIDSGKSRDEVLALFKTDDADKDAAEAPPKKE